MTPISTSPRLGILRLLVRASRTETVAQTLNRRENDFEPFRPLFRTHLRHICRIPCPSSQTQHHSYSNLASKSTLHRIHRSIGESKIDSNDIAKLLHGLKKHGKDLAQLAGKKNVHVLDPDVVSQGAEDVAPEADDLHLVHEGLGMLEHEAVNVLHHVARRLGTVSSAQGWAERASLEAFESL